MDMLERVAQAMKERAKGTVGSNRVPLAPVLVGSLGDAWMAFAFAALKAMREPTEAMIEAAERDAIPSGDACDAAEVWRAMIDAILNDAPNHAEPIKTIEEAREIVAAMAAEDLPHWMISEAEIREVLAGRIFEQDNPAKERRTAGDIIVPDFADPTKSS